MAVALANAFDKVAGEGYDPLGSRANGLGGTAKEARLAEEMIITAARSGNDTGYTTGTSQGISDGRKAVDEKKRAERRSAEATRMQILADINRRIGELDGLIAQYDKDLTILDEISRDGITQEDLDDPERRKEIADALDMDPADLKVMSPEEARELAAPQREKRTQQRDDAISERDALKRSYDRIEANENYRDVLRDYQEQGYLDDVDIALIRDEYEARDIISARLLDTSEPSVSLFNENLDTGAESQIAEFMQEFALQQMIAGSPEELRESLAEQLAALSDDAKAQLMNDSEIAFLFEEPQRVLVAGNGLSQDTSVQTSNNNDNIGNLTA